MFNVSNFPSVDIFLETSPTHSHPSPSLFKYIGVICHVYLDGIVIWSNSIQEHQKNVRTILQALREAHLYCSTKKSHLFATEVDFLGHHISELGVEPDGKKVEKIQKWPVPRCAKDM